MKNHAIGWLSRLAVLGAGCLVAAAAPAGAQLAETLWLETLTVFADAQLDDSSGVDALAPEPLAGSLSGNGWSVNGEVEYGPAGPPSVTTSAGASYESGLQSYLASTTYVMIHFEFRLRQLGTPPVPISQVPLTVHSRGSVTASGNLPMYSSAFVFLDLATMSGPLVGLQASASNDPEGDPGSDSFDQVVPFDLGPNETVFGSMVAGSQVLTEVLVSGLQGAAMAFIDPVVVVVDEAIPGTSTSYRDVYEVEFGDGYYALGNPTPVQGTTWGQVKSLYREGRARR